MNYYQASKTSQVQNTEPPQNAKVLEGSKGSRLGKLANRTPLFTYSFFFGDTHVNIRSPVVWLPPCLPLTPIGGDSSQTPQNGT